MAARSVHKHGYNIYYRCVFIRRRSIDIELGSSRLEIKYAYGFCELLTDHSSLRLLDNLFAISQ